MNNRGNDFIYILQIKDDKIDHGVEININTWDMLTILVQSGWE